MRGKRRPPEQRVSSVTGPLPPCRVCGEKAAGFHYGVNTCEACKGFFRRSLLRNGEYECAWSGNCVIGPNRRKSCQKCRYLKCISSGMSKEAIKTGRYTYMKKTQDTLELKTLKQANQKSSSNFLMDIDCFSHTILAESATYSFNQGRLQEGVHAVDGYIRNSCSHHYSGIDSSPTINSCSHHYSGSDASPNFRTECKPMLPPVSNPSSALTGCMSDSTTDIMSIGPYISQNSMSKLNNIEGLINTGLSLTECYNPSSPSIICNPELDNTQCSRLLSSLPSEVDSDFCLGSEQLLHPHIPCGLKSWSLAEEASSLSGCSSHSLPASPLPLQEESRLIGLDSWHVYSDAELDEFITTIVSGHKVHVEDANNISDQHLQELFRECKERCSLQTEIFGHLGVIKKDEHSQIYTSTGLDVDGRLDDLSYAAQKMNVYVQQMISFLKLIPGFQSLCLSDQTALVKASMCDLCLLGFFRGYNRDELIVVEASRSYCRHQMVKFNMEGDLDMIFVISQRLQNLYLSYEIIVVLKALCVFFSDRATIEEPDAVEQLQLKIVQCLMLLLRRHYLCEHGMMFARILSILAQIRSHAEDCHKSIVANLLSESYSEVFYNVPIIFEFLKYTLE